MKEETNSLKKPNVFIVGAPKSGTSSFAEYLKQHPDFFISYPKEPNYFNSDMLQGFSTEEDYLKIFAQANGVKAIGEASPMYLVSKIAAENISKFDPCAKIVVLLRNPVELVYSLYWQNRYSGVEDAQTFEEALSLQESRKNGNDIPNKNETPELLFYDDMVDFVPQIKRYWKKFGNANTKVIIFDDIKKDVRTEFSNLCKFINISDNLNTIQFKIYNPYQANRSQLLKKFILSPPLVIKKIAKKLAVPASWKSFIFRTVKNINTQTTVKPKMEKRLEVELQERYRGKIQELEKILERDLSDWYGGAK